MKPKDVKYETCDYYAAKGNEIVMDLFNTEYHKIQKEYIEPDERHCVYDMRIDFPNYMDSGETYTYFVEVKLKFNKKFYNDYTYITDKKVREINEFMENKDKTHNKFLYLNYYPMCGGAALFDLTTPREYKHKQIWNTNSTADNPDIKPYEDIVDMTILPMDNPKYFKYYDYKSPIQITYNNETYQYGTKIFS